MDRIQTIVDNYFTYSYTQEEPSDFIYDLQPENDLGVPFNRSQMDTIIELIYAETDRKLDRINRALERLGLENDLVVESTNDALVTVYGQSWTGYLCIRKLDESLTYMDRHRWNLGQIKELCDFVDHHGE